MTQRHGSSKLQQRWREKWAKRIPFWSSQLMEWHLSWLFGSFFQCHRKKKKRRKRAGLEKTQKKPEGILVFFGFFWRFFFRGGVLGFSTGRLRTVANKRWLCRPGVVSSNCTAPLGEMGSDSDIKRKQRLAPKQLKKRWKKNGHFPLQNVRKKQVKQQKKQKKQKKRPRIFWV